MKNIRTGLAALLTAAVLLTGCSGGSEAGLPSGESSAVSVSADTAADTDGNSSEMDTPSEAGGTVSAEEKVSAAEDMQSEPESAQTAEQPTESTSADTASTVEDEQMSEEVKYIALTFDDGPNSTTTNDVIDKLEKHEIVASFFLIGNNISDESAKAVKRAYDLGCEIGNHSRTHSDMTQMTEEDIKAEYDFVDEKVFEIIGEHTKFFRPPYISVNQKMFDTIDVPFIAGIGAADWEERNTAEKRARAILRQAKDGDIILLHDMEGNSATVEALDTIIPELKAQGYQFVTVSELFRAKGIEPNMERVYTNVMQQTTYA